MASSGGGATTLGDGIGSAISGGGMPDTGCGTLFRSVPAEFNHWCTLSKVVKIIARFMHHSVYIEVHVCSKLSLLCVLTWSHLQL